MIFRGYEIRLLLRVTLLFLSLLGLSVIIVRGWYEMLIIAIPITLFILTDMLRFQKKAHNEVEQFAESVHYRDFSRHFDVNRAPIELKPLRKGFNDINTTFKTISRERETQYQYLQKIVKSNQATKSKKCCCRRKYFTEFLQHQLYYTLPPAYYRPSK